MAWVLHSGRETLGGGTLPLHGDIPAKKLLTQHEIHLDSNSLFILLPVCEMDLQGDVEKWDLQEQELRFMVT